MALINGTAYSWNQIVVQFTNASLPLMGVVNIEYNEEQEKEDFYAAGSRAYERGYGNIKATASITLKLSDVVNLERQAPFRDIKNLPKFDIIVSYIHPDSTKITSDIIKNVEFTSSSKSWAQNDMSLEVELPLIASHIVYAR